MSSLQMPMMPHKFQTPKIPCCWPSCCPRTGANDMANSIPLSVSFTLWRLIQKKMYDLNMHKCGCNLSLMCSLCNNHTESSSHIIFGCRFIMSIWKKILSIFEIWILPKSDKDLLQMTNLGCIPRHFSHIGTSYLACQKWETIQQLCNWDSVHHWRHFGTY